MRDDQAGAFCSPLYATDSTPGTNTSVFHTTIPSFQTTAATIPKSGMLKPNLSSQQNHNSLPYRSGFPWAYNDLLPPQNEPDLFDMMHRPQAKSVNLAEEEKEMCTNSNASDYVVLGPVESYMTPAQSAARMTYLGRQYLPPVGPTNSSLSFFMNSQIHPQPNRPYPLPQQQQHHHQQQQQQVAQEPVTPIPVTVQQVSAHEEKQADPSKHPALSKVLNTEIRGAEDCQKLITETAGPKYPISNAITSISQLLTSTVKNNSPSLSGSPTSRSSSNGGRRECVKCGALFTPIMELNGSKQLLCNGCGVVKPVRIPSPDVRDSRGTPSPMRNSPSPSPFKDKKKQVYPQRIDATCTNCRTSNTSLWRRDHKGDTVCNACGLYYKLHGIQRPISMRKDGAIIRRRKGNKMVSVGD